MTPVSYWSNRKVNRSKFLSLLNTRIEVSYLGLLSKGKATFRNSGLNMPGMPRRSPFACDRRSSLGGTSLHFHSLQLDSSLLQDTFTWKNFFVMYNRCELNASFLVRSNLPCQQCEIKVDKVTLQPVKIHMEVIYCVIQLHMLFYCVQMSSRSTQISHTDNRYLLVASAIKFVYISSQNPTVV